MPDSMEPLTKLERLRLAHQGCCCSTSNPKKIEKNNVSLHMNLRNAQHIVSIDCDICCAFRDADKRPDYIVVVALDPEEYRYAVLEITSGHVRRDNLDKLEKGGEKCLHSALFSFAGDVESVFAILHCGELHTADIQVIQRRGVMFQSRKRPVRLVRCRPCQTSLNNVFY